MKTLLAFAVSAVFAMASAQGAVAAPNLAAFSGKYQGTTTLMWSGNTFTGSSSMVFSVNLSKRAGTLKVTANVVSMGVPYDVGNAFQFTGRRVMNLSQTAPPIVTTALSGGSYQSGTRSIRGTVTYMTAQVLVTCRVQQTGHKVTLTVVETITESGVVVYQITYVGTKHLPVS
jgi:opacity protein-like surface antigen